MPTFFKPSCHPIFKLNLEPNLKPVFSALMLATQLALTACGGGGGGDTPPQDPQQPICLAMPEVTWQRSATASADWNDVAIDAQGRIWLAGWTDGQIGQSRSDPGGNSRAVLRQLAPDGRLLWDSGPIFDTPGTDAAEALALAADGTVHVAGRTTGAMAGTPNAGQFDTFVAWSHLPTSVATWRSFQTGSERPQRPRRLAIAANGELHLAGYDEDWVPSNHVAAWSDSFALKLARRADGSTLDTRWAHQFGSDEPDTVDGLAIGADGATFVSGVIAGGHFRGMFVRKLDATGQALWTARYSSLGIDHIAALQRLPDGDLLIAGSVFGSFRGGVHQGQQDVFVARIAASDGRTLASWQFGSPEGEWLTDMKLDAQGNIYLFGETTGSLVPGQANAGNSDLFLLKLDPQGEVLARRQWGTADSEASGRLAVDRCGRVAAVGSSTTVARRSGVLWVTAP